MGKYFGTDGFRGEANVDLTADHAYKVGRFLGWYYNIRSRQGAASLPVSSLVRIHADPRICLSMPWLPVLPLPVRMPTCST